MTQGSGPPLQLAGLERARAVLGAWLGTPAARAELLGDVAAAPQ
jgi:hypothetical protein